MGEVDLLRVSYELACGIRSGIGKPDYKHISILEIRGSFEQLRMNSSAPEMLDSGNLGDIGQSVRSCRNNDSVKALVLSVVGLHDPGLRVFVSIYGQDFDAKS
jgi:hypothetical protein